MSKVPPQRFTTEEFPEQEDWIGKLLEPLNQFTGNVVRAFTNKVTIEDNLYEEIKEIKFVYAANNFPLKFLTKFKTQPKGLVPIYLYNNTLSAYATAAPWPIWVYQDGQVVISDISGLTANQTYTIRLRVAYG